MSIAGSSICVYTTVRASGSLYKIRKRLRHRDGSFADTSRAQTFSPDSAFVAFTPYQLATTLATWPLWLLAVLGVTLLLPPSFSLSRARVLSVRLTQPDERCTSTYIRVYICERGHAWRREKRVRASRASARTITTSLNAVPAVLRNPGVGGRRLILPCRCVYVSPAPPSTDD